MVILKNLISYWKNEPKIVRRGCKYYARKRWHKSHQFLENNSIHKRPDDYVYWWTSSYHLEYCGFDSSDDAIKAVGRSKWLESGEDLGYVNRI
jgi:hypothetical protein